MSHLDSATLPATPCLIDSCVLFSARSMSASSAIRTVLGNPAKSLAWLVNKLAQSELALEEGEVVLSGAMIGSVRLAAGDILKATFGGGLGPVGVKFV